MGIIRNHAKLNQERHSPTETPKHSQKVFPDQQEVYLLFGTHYCNQIKESRYVYVIRRGRLVIPQPSVNGEDFPLHLFTKGLNRGERELASRPSILEQHLFN